MNKVLVFIPNIGTNGISKIMTDCIDNMNNTDNIELLTYTIEDDIYIKDKSIKVNTLGKSHSIFKRFKFLKDFFRNNNCDVIHVNGNYCSRLIECIAAKRAGVKKIIVHSHSGCVSNASPIKIFLHKLLKKLFDIYATDYLACGDEAAKWMFSKKIYNNKKYRIINNGINVDIFKHNPSVRTKIRSELNIKDDEILLGFVGRLTYAKNPLYLLDIINNCKKNNIKAKLLIIGDGEYKNKMDDKINRLGINKDVIFTGVVNNVYDYYNAMDVFLLPSNFEGLAVVAVEAQTNGLYSLISDKVSDECKLTDLVSFIPIEETSISIWTKKIKEINEKLVGYDREKYYNDIVNSKFSIKDTAKQMEGIYNK